MKIEQDSFNGGFNFGEPEKKSNNKVIVAISIGIVITLMIVIAIIITIMTIEERQLKVYIDGKEVSNVSQAFLFDEQSGKVYVSIRDIAPFVNYEAHNGEYKIDSEDKTKMYVEAKDGSETTSFYLNSTLISKVAPNTSDDYQHIDIGEAVFERNDKFYISTEGFMKGFNVVFSYNTEQNNIIIQTLPYLVNYYSTNVSNYNKNYKSISEEFYNQKAIIYGMLVANNANGKLGVINIENGDEVLGPRYNKIEFVENANEFIITNGDKVGIAYSNGKTKIEVKFDEIKVLDSTLGYYLVKSKLSTGEKYGVIDSKENFIVHIEYDQIGVDTKDFQTDRIDNKYILYDKLIPVCLNKKWGFFDIKGNKIVDAIYDNVGCINSDLPDKVVNNAMIIGETEIVVVEQGGKYGGIDLKGEVIVPTVFNYVYSIENGGNTEYYINLNGVDYRAEEFIELQRKQLGAEEPKRETEDEGNGDNTEENNETENNTPEDNTVENNTTENNENSSTENENNQNEVENPDNQNTENTENNEENSEQNNNDENNNSNE